MLAIWKTLSEFKPANVAFESFKSVPNLFINRGPHLDNEKIIEELEEDLSVNPFYFDYTTHGSNTLFPVLWGYLIFNGFKYQQHPKHYKFTHGIAKP